MRRRVYRRRYIMSPGNDYGYRHGNRYRYGYGDDDNISNNNNNNNNNNNINYGNDENNNNNSTNNNRHDVGQENRNMNGRHIFGSGRIEKRVSVASEEIERFLCSHPSYVPTYNKMVYEYNETQARRQKMAGLQHSSKYIRKHAPLLYDIENVNHVMDYVLNHPDNVNRRM